MTAPPTMPAVAPIIPILTVSTAILTHVADLRTQLRQLAINFLADGFRPSAILSAIAR
jgi:hypothetical protein